ncbi:sulfotransferase [Blastococcus brunescens]|uniref:Sulfotransferase n=1 Tax=Blastococcus brunescens TaxID=1564165 RepID=A0ABZ1B748_9ACTN|nr:sulfotransferase [Blastococcus sp. BMG 8361]WRL66611.1 sulfotransferase [Blastococcus sp. BMG 8361]
MDRARTEPTGALPNLVLIGAMKCGTTSLHRYLDLHPDVAMSRPKELNFFLGPDRRPEQGTGRHAGNWHRGPEWYAARFDADAPLRGEASPGYTSPDHPDVAGRMAELIPGAHLLYAVRDPIERAVSQYWHHRRDGTETREPAEALRDPASQYVSRGRYFQRLAPFLATGAFHGRITVVAREHLRDRPRATLRGLFGALGVDDGHWSTAMDQRRNAAPERPPPVGEAVRRELRAALAEDAARFRDFTGEEFAEWSV